MFSYSIHLGVMSENGVSLPGACYSGQQEAKNDPARVSEVGVGPIPPGRYRIGPAYMHPHLGPCVMILDPLPGTDTLGRAEFRIHGDSIKSPGTAARGCIVAPYEMRLHIDRA